MGGKASILMVLGFSLIFLVMGHNFGNISNHSVENLEAYFTNTMAHNIAVSGANMAANEIFIDKSWDTGYSNLSFSGGTIDVSVASIDQMKEITSIGTYKGYDGLITKTVRVLLQPSNFAKFGNFYYTISAMPATGDTFNGPFHTQGKLKTHGTPVFWGKTTAKNGLEKKGNPKDPKFYGGFESGIDIPLEFDTSGMRLNAAANGIIFRDTSGANKSIDVNLTFNSDGTITTNFKIADGLNIWSPEITVPLNTLTPNGLIYVEKGNIFAKGTLCGRATIVATKKGAGGSGNIYQTDDIVYNEDPLVNPNSTDMLGMIAENNIRILYNGDTKHDDIITQASMFALKGNIGPDDDLVHNDGFLARWKILGGLIADKTRITAHYSSSIPYEGYKFVHTFDERFKLVVPPFFPHTRHYEIVSWYE